MNDSFYITTPIYYVNDLPHIGHAYTTVAADVLARYHRFIGDEVYFLTGTDEHGQKNLRAAEERGLDAQAYVDSMVPQWIALWKRLGISNDIFFRTTNPDHIKGVQEFWQRLYDSGDVYLGSYEGLYCVSCEDFYKEEDLVGGNCPTHGRPVERVAEENYFFRLSRYSDWLLNEYFARTPSPVRPASSLKEMTAFVGQGLQDISISRSSFAWGVPIPWDERHVFYVWIDALVNYITALDFPDGERFKRHWPGVHFVGKDILRFHSVIWPAMLHAAGLEPPQTVFAHGWLLVGGEKMSKTKLTGIHPDQLIDPFGVDAYRYIFLREFAFGQDGNFSWESTVARYNAELANGIGNLVSRVLAMLVSSCGGVVPSPGEVLDERDARVRTVVEESARMYQIALEQFAFHDALEAIDAIVREANGYLVDTAPWKLAKDPSQGARVDAVLYTAAETLRVLALLLAPFTPSTSEQICSALGLGDSLDSVRFPDAFAWGGLPTGAAVTRGPSLFPRFEG